MSEVAEVLTADSNAKIELGEKLTETQAREIITKGAEKKSSEKESKAEKTPVVNPPVKEKLPLPAESKAPEAKIGEDGKPVVEPVIEKKIKKKALEQTQEFFKPTPKEEKAPDVKEIQSQLETLKKRNEELETELKDPIYQVSKAVKEKGGKALDIFKEIKVVDHSKMSDEDLYKYELAKNGVTDAEEQASEWEKFNESSALTRKKEIQAIRNGIDIDNQNVEKQFLSRVNAKDPNDERMVQQAIKDGNEIDATLKSLVGRPVIEGVLFTEDIRQKIVDNIANQRVLIPTKEDGTTDINALIQREIKAEMFDLVVETITANTEAETIHKVYNELEATPDSHTQTSRPPEPIHKVEQGTEEYAKIASASLTPMKR